MQLPKGQYTLADHLTFRSDTLFTRQYSLVCHRITRLWEDGSRDHHNMPFGAGGGNRAGGNKGAGAKTGKKGREAAPKGVDKKSGKQLEKKEKPKVLEAKAVKAQKKEKQKERSERLIAEGKKVVGGNKDYRTVEERDEELDGGDWTQIHGKL